MPSSTESASPPNSPTSASHAIVPSHCRTAGNTTPPPNAIRELGSWPVPVRGPHVDRYPTTSEPSTVPITIASRPSQKPSPSTIASAPVNTPVMLTCGANHTVNSRAGEPYR